MVKKNMNKIGVDDGESGDKLANEYGKRKAEPLTDDKAKKIKTKSLYKQPTVRELTRLNETETLFNSNLFRLQVEEILEEVKIKEKTEKKFQEWFVNFKKHLDAVPEKKTEYDLLENKLYKELKVKCPLGDDLQTKCSFQFHKFNSVDIIGSYALGCAINSKLVIDIQITVPAATYLKNDSINYRYHKKRAAYLAYLASYLKSFSGIEDIQYQSSTCHTKPVLQLKPTGKLGNNLSIHVHLACDVEAYKLERFSPSRNNVRESWLMSFESPENELGPPTPYYNSTILSDITAPLNNELLTKVLTNNDNLKQAIVLLKIWLRQRKLKVSGQVVSLFVAYLVQLKRINNVMSSYQIVRNVWIALKTSEWDTQGISLHKGNGPPLQEFLENFPVVFIDTTGYYNLCFQMCAGTYKNLRRESGLAIEMLDNGSINSFLPLFMTPFEPVEQFDHIVRFNDLSQTIEAVHNAAPLDDKINYGVDKLALVTQTLYRLFEKGLGERVQLIQECLDTEFNWSVTKKLEKARSESNYEQKLSFGLILDPENAMNILDKGPAANLPEAEQFRAFWGDKSELRRFQDGSITETCVWDATSLAERRMVARQIVRYLLQHKYGIQDHITYIGDQLDSILTRKLAVPSDGVVGTGEELSLKAIQAFDDLRRELRSLTELPLEVNSVHGTSPILSYTDPLPPVGARKFPNPWRRASTCLIKDIVRDDQVHLPAYVPVCEAVIEMGHSGKWPGDLQAFLCLKAAFHQQISDRLTKEHATPAQAYPTHIDVLKNGFVFRLRIAHTKEITLLKREVEKGVVKYRDTDRSLKMLRECVVLPKLRGALHGLHQKYPAYGPTTCLLKRFISSHLIDDSHFPSTAIELLVASVFVNPVPLTVTLSPIAAFVRVLKKLANTDWKTECLLLDFNGDLNAEEIQSIEQQSKSRTDGMPALFVVTSQDIEYPSIYTREAPTARVLSRVCTLAKAAVAKTVDTVHDCDELLGTFIPTYTGYDVTIHLHPHVIPYSGERPDQPPLMRRLEAHEPDDFVPVAGFNAVEIYLQELRSAYSDFALFFHDQYGGEVITVLWKPDIAELKEFQVSVLNATEPVKVNKETKYRVKKSAIIEDFRIIGRGLVKDVIVH